MAETALSPPQQAIASATAAIARDSKVSPAGSPLGELPSAPSPPSLDLSPLQALALRALLSALDQIAEPKTLLLDAELAGPLGLVCDVGSLRAHGVERMFWLEDNPGQGSQKVVERDVNAPTRAVVYVCRPQLGLMRVIAGHILHDRKNAASSASLSHTYHALFSPRRTELSLHLFSTIATPSLLSDLNLYDLGLELVPLEYDVLSLEEESSWADIWAKGDHGVVHRAAMALMTMQHVWGAFPKIVGKGDMAKRLSDLLVRQRREYLASDPTNPALSNPSKAIDGVIILDRAVDLATPLCTQLTYEGLVDEIVGIKSAHVEVDPSLVSSEPSSQSAGATAGSMAASGSGTPLREASAQQKRKTKKARLDTTTDPLFGSIRDSNFAIVGERLHEAAKRLNKDYEKRHAAKTVAEMRAFVQRLGGLQQAHASLRLHTGLTERIMDATTKEVFNASLELQQNIIAGLDLAAQLNSIEDLITASAPFLVVMRLLCLLSVVSGGLKPKNLEYLKREILQTYGYSHLPLLLTLSDVGLLTRATPSSTRSSIGFSAARQPLRLVDDEVDERNPSDISYVYSGYAPLSVRLVQLAASRESLAGPSTRRRPAASKGAPIQGWRGYEDVVNCLPGSTFEEDQLPSSAAAAAAAASTTTTKAVVPPTTLVFFLGGVTYAEISALRLLNSLSTERRFVVATTSIISGDRMIQSLEA